MLFALLKKLQNYAIFMLKVGIFGNDLFEFGISTVHCTTWEDPNDIDTLSLPPHVTADSCIYTHTITTQLFGDSALIVLCQTWHAESSLTQLSP